MCQARTRSFLQTIGKRTANMRRAARRFLCSTDVDHLPIDLDLVAQQAGLVVKRTDETMDEALWTEVAGIMYPSREWDVILLNADIDPMQQRFTLAHEMAEWYLGKETHVIRKDDVVDPLTRANNYDTGSVGGDLNSEVECDVWASEIIIPTPLLAEEAYHERDLDALARTFGVTRQMIVQKFWLVNLDPFAYTPTELQDQYFAKAGPWARMLHQRFYGGKTLWETYNLPGFPRTRAQMERESRRIV